MFCKFSQFVAKTNGLQLIRRKGAVIWTNNDFRRNMSLLLNKALINGEWISAKSNAELDVVNPANGSIVGRVPDFDAKDVENAIDAANEAFHSTEWSSLTAKERSALLKVNSRPLFFFNNYRNTKIV